jgi:hypothetical protein
MRIYTQRKAFGLAAALYMPASVDAKMVPCRLR